MSLNSTRVKVEELHANKLLTRRAVEHTYVGLFLSAYTAFEGFLEDLFVGLLVAKSGQVFHRGKATPRVVIRSKKVAFQILLKPGKDYLDWLPYNYTIERANAFFRGGRPFTTLVDVHRDHLTKIVVLRNAIAHQSSFAQEQFTKKVIGSTKLPPRERTPARYLCGNFRNSPAQTRQEVILANTVQLAAKLAGY
jgi:hypothetical protein